MKISKNLYRLLNEQLDEAVPKMIKPIDTLV